MATNINMQSGNRKKASAAALEGIEDFFPPNFHRQAVSGGVAPEMSGKFMVLDRLLREIRATTDDRCVLISNYTQVRLSFRRIPIGWT